MVHLVGLCMGVGSNMMEIGKVCSGLRNSCVE